MDFVSLTSFHPARELQDSVVHRVTEAVKGQGLGDFEDATGVATLAPTIRA